MLLVMVAICSVCSIWAYTISGEYRLFLYIGVALVFVAIQTAVSLASDINNTYHGSISDMIVLDAEGVWLCAVKSEKIFIPWAEVVSITKEWNFRLASRIFVKGADGSEIWWFYENMDAEDYIRKEHPELEGVMTKTGRLR